MSLSSLAAENSAVFWFADKSVLSLTVVLDCRLTTHTFGKDAPARATARSHQEVEGIVSCKYEANRTHFTTDHVPSLQPVFGEWRSGGLVGVAGRGFLETMTGVFTAKSL